MSPLPQPGAGEKGHDDKLGRDLTEAAGADHHPHLAELRRLLIASERGDVRARDELTQSHLDWVLEAARERAGRGLSISDLFQEGTIGLLEAIDQFKSSDKEDFESFVRDAVAGRMNLALEEEERVLNDGRQLVQAAEDYTKAETSIRSELGRTGSDVELAEKLEWSVARTQEIGQIVADARRRHDEELIQYLDPADLDLDTLIDHSPAEDGPADDER